MIASLKGRVADVDGERAVVEVGGVGFAVQVPAALLSALSRQTGREVFLHTYLHVREDSLQLFGFADERQRQLFLALLSVSGVGPKLALAILSAYPVDQLEAAVLRGDTRKLESIPGVGKRLAQRLAVELKDRVGEAVVPVAGEVGPAGGEGQASEWVLARKALEKLGLSLREAEEALQGAPDGATVEELVRHALKKKASHG